MNEKHSLNILSMKEDALPKVFALSIRSQDSICLGRRSGQRHDALS